MRGYTAAVCLLLAATPLALAWQADAPAEDSFRIFRDTDLEGKSVEVPQVTSVWASRMNDLDKHIRNKGKSLEWNLPRGVVVVLYDNTNSTGRQFPIWGKGSRSSLKSADFEKRAAGWAWVYVDGWEGSSAAIIAGLSPRPLLTEKSDKIIATNTLQFDRNAGAIEKNPDKMLKVEAVTDVPEGELQTLPDSMNNRASSMRWNLPAGVVVVLYDKADGTGRRMPLWGDGETPKLRSMSDRISAWAWYNVAAEDAKPDPH